MTYRWGKVFCRLRQKYEKLGIYGIGAKRVFVGNYQFPGSSRDDREALI